MQRVRVVFRGGVVMFLLAAARLAAADTCTDLTRLAMPQATVDRATLVPSGTFDGPDLNPPFTTVNRQALPEFCRVEATARPTSDSEIRIEAWLPVSGWNGRFAGVGNGGWGGAIYYGAMAYPLRRGFAVVGTDAGHGTAGTTWAVGHPEKFMDFGYRAIHEMTVLGRAAVTAYYGRQPERSYFVGCSTGGRQAITEAARFPDDYDGIVAGAPAIYFGELTLARVARSAMLARAPEAAIPPDTLPAIHAAVLDACDGRDGVRDGVLENPLLCGFDPGTLQCRGDGAQSCLSPAQVETARRLYAPVSLGRAGTFPPMLRPGTELGWRSALTEEPGAMRDLVFMDPRWTAAQFDSARDAERVLDSPIGRVLGVTEPNLKPFFDGGGKLLIYHGWQDPQVPAQLSVRYFEEVQRLLGPGVVGTSMQLYMFPGMAHCAGGAGVNSFDSLDVIDRFVTTGQAPASVVGTRSAGGKVELTRPVCAWGQVAKWNGLGSTSDAASYSCERVE